MKKSVVSKANESLLLVGKLLHQGHWDAVSRTRHREQSIYAVSEGRPIAAFSISKILMSDIGKLRRKMALSRHTRWSAASQTTLCCVQGWRALQVLIMYLTDLSNEDFWRRHTLRSAKISDGWRHMQIMICTSKQMFERVSAATSAIGTENCSSQFLGGSRRLTAILRPYSAFMIWNSTLVPWLGDVAVGRTVKQCKPISKCI